MAEIIGSGAEAVIYLDKGLVIKDRLQKSYRISDIDSRLRKSRTKREAKVLEKLCKIGFPSPKFMDITEDTRLSMGFINGGLIRDVLHQDNLKLGLEIGRKIALLHENDIIHGDLTTSNMILGKEIHFIDFGLSFFSTKIEDKAVDLHLLKQALESKHYKIFKETFDAVLEGYRDFSGHELVLERLKAVDARGRYKKKAK